MVEKFKHPNEQVRSLLHVLDTILVYKDTTQVLEADLEHIDVRDSHKVHDLHDSVYSYELFNVYVQLRLQSYKFKIVL